MGSLIIGYNIIDKFRKSGLKIKEFCPQNCSDGFKLSMSYKIYHWYRQW